MTRQLTMSQSSRSRISCNLANLFVQFAYGRSMMSCDMFPAVPSTRLDMGLMRVGRCRIYENMREFHLSSSNDARIAMKSTRISSMKRMPFVHKAAAVSQRVILMIFCLLSTTIDGI